MNTILKGWRILLWVSGIGMLITSLILSINNVFSWQHFVTDVVMAILLVTLGEYLIKKLRR